MELIESKQILKNLNAVLLVAKERLAREFIMQDVELNDIFKVDFKNYLSEKNWEVEYFRSTTVITNHQGQNIYVANQWFVIASYFVDFCTELLTYRNLFVKLCKEYLGLNAEEMKKFLEQKTTTITGVFSCKGYDTYGPFKLIGGLNKQHPDGNDIQNAVQFYENLLK